MEQCHFYRYVKNSTGYKMKNGHKVIYYNCHRSYAYEEKKGAFQKTSKKIGYACPARIVCTICNDGQVNIEYFKTHVGHEIILKYLPLDQHSKNLIKDKILAGVEDDIIMESVREASFNNELPLRASLITKKDIRNIKNRVLPKQATVLLTNQEKELCRTEEKSEEINNLEEPVTSYSDDVDAEDIDYDFLTELMREIMKKIENRQVSDINLCIKNLLNTLNQM
ncbi:uncharacterized protein LOC113383259 [Ctenocephalides felis]|uniref:uncharacterized protein LOC113383259 n=1 Tax=Ctenocephalides felis TaxID=7515 RepID=UPI000E6E394A|nr:uncharacterized protein LOC113383259 [Ctenocephalides felis]